MLKKLISKAPSTEILDAERSNLEEAMQQATETRRPQTVEVDGKMYRVEDDGYGREIKPA